MTYWKCRLRATNHRLRRNAKTKHNDVDLDKSKANNIYEDNKEIGSWSWKVSFWLDIIIIAETRLNAQLL